jgi:hypothetical protein
MRGVPVPRDSIGDGVIGYLTTDAALVEAAAAGNERAARELRHRAQARLESREHTESRFRFPWDRLARSEPGQQVRRARSMAYKGSLYVTTRSLDAIRTLISTSGIFFFVVGAREMRIGAATYPTT